MPLISSSYSNNPFYLFNGHLQTIVPSLFRVVDHVKYRRERITLPDTDFLDLDWVEVQSKELAIVSHGLEGSTDRPYIKGMVSALNKANIDALAWNYRTCSGESNKLLRTYHLGATDDLHLVINHALNQQKYHTIYLIGFSAGGNITLKYLGEDPAVLPKEIKKAAVFSVPCHLRSSADKLSTPFNQIYLKRFLKSLEEKLTSKAVLFPDELNLTDYHQIKSFWEFDNRYTAPMHGFKDADDYYTHCSSVFYIKNIQVPTLLVNALNDPFLAPPCFPVEEANENPSFFLEMPRHGGHVGFPEGNLTVSYYAERRAVEFLNTSK
ncbi:YheT family hydrolase [Adhaeribacter aquaticus]|uniref:YheT family hydrolase n=1 Tax=Adhaeribacter aquaticus TaxID=299567 RepID=UPI00040BD711|nr:alpha/beta fold hydrolase [Adhaeribacter aquaticus]